MSAREFVILSATEPDRPGLIAEITGFIADRGCNVDDSRVAVLGGYAGLIFLVSGTTEQVGALERELELLERGTGVRAVARRLAGHVSPAADAPGAETYIVTASAMDHEGLIHALTDTVRANGGNILELETSTESAPMSGSPLFGLRMVVSLAERHGSAVRLRQALDALARAEAMDLVMTPAAAGVGG